MPARLVSTLALSWISMPRGCHVSKLASSKFSRPRGLHITSSMQTIKGTRTGQLFPHLGHCRPKMIIKREYRYKTSIERQLHDEMVKGKTSWEREMVQKRNCKRNERRFERWIAKPAATRSPISYPARSLSPKACQKYK